MSPDDGAIPLSRIRARLARPRGTRQVESLLSADDPTAAVAALSVPELYQVIRDVGLGDTYELVALATPDQVRGCLDLDVWDRDRVQVDAVKPWLAALIDAGPEKLAQTWAGLDAELTALTLARITHIYDLSLGEEVPDNEERPLYETPDTFFAVAIDAEDEETIVLVRRLLDDLYKGDMVLARHTLMSARSEPVAELEEMSYRWRSGRLADLGYVDYYDALDVFRPLDAASVQLGEGTQDDVAAVDLGDEDRARAPRELPVPVAERLVGKSFLARALAQVGDAGEAERLEAAFVIVTNKVLSALRISPADEEGVLAGSDYAMSSISLGLERISGGDLERAAHALCTISLTRLHRLGFSATLPLARFARQVAPRAAGAGEPAGALLEALSGPRPQTACELDDPPNSGPRPFESTDDIRRAAEELTRLALRIALAEALGADLIASADRPAAGPDLDDFIRTALVRATVGDEPTPTPLPSTLLQQFRRDAFADDLLTDSARSRAHAAVEALLDAAEVAAGRPFAGALVDGWLDQLEETFGGLDADQAPDPRFLAGVFAEVDLA